ncbi:RusA-like Holliday junction resolvase [Gordonia phage BritBrat]|uniref:Resolvase n=1 Tax=Gordonia phage BritBrat TaxID=1838064 RepID=A0A166Y0Y6_9CAUD|nr:RusA-like Holliday junction resolvase [Gordonia phage BritBrat]ANA85292.1 resolvase [Gordonia phage BritBrat]
MSTHRIDLPWTKPPLSMNDRGYTKGAAMAKSALTARIRQQVQLLAVLHQLPRNVAHTSVQLHYRPCDNRRRDTDNLVATLKPICDALAAGTKTHPGYGLVPDDTPQYMAKPEPIIHPAGKKSKRGSNGRAIGEMWLELHIEEAQ